MASDDNQGAPEGETRRSRSVRSAGWTTIGHGLAQVIRLASSIILTRFLVPEIYGLMELVYVFYTALLLFSDVGIATCIVHSPRGDDPDFLNTAWTLQVIRGVVLFVASFLLAYPAASFYEEPSLVMLVPAIGLVALIEGFDATSLHTERRRINLSSVVKLELSMQVVAVVVQVAIALVWPSVWVLVIGSWVGAITRLVGSHRFLPSIRHRFFIDRDAVREIFVLGRWIFGSTALHFVSMQADRLFLGKVLDSVAGLGIYAIAGRLKTAVMALAEKLIRDVLFAALAERNRELDQDDPNRGRELSRLFYKGRLPLDALFVTGAGGLCAVAPLLIWILYPKEYGEAGEILRIFSVEIALTVALAPGEMLLSAVGMTQYGFMRSVGRALWVVIVVPLGWYSYGFYGLVWAVSLANIPTLVVIWSGLLRHGFFNILMELRAVAFYCLGWVLGAGVVQMLGPLIGFVSTSSASPSP